MTSQYPDSGMPPTYDNNPSSTGAGVGSSRVGTIDGAFVISIDGIFKVVEMILSLIVFICASIEADFIPEGGGWVQFVSITALLLIIVLYVMYMFGFIYNMPHAIPRYLILFIFYATYTLFYFISGIVAAAWASNADAVAACTFFTFCTMLVFGADTYFHFTTWRENNADMPNPPMTTPAQSTPTTGPPSSGSTPAATGAPAAPAGITTVEIQAQY